MSDVALDVPEWLVPWFSIYYALLEQAAEVLHKRRRDGRKLETRALLGTTGYTSEDFVVRELTWRSSMRPAQVRVALQVMIDNGLVLRRDVVGLRLLDTPELWWHQSNMVKLLLEWRGS